MDFFEKLGKKATETFNSAAEKTNKIASETKIKIKINDCKSKIKDLYQEIGKIVYQKFATDGDVGGREDIEEQLSKISELTSQVENFEKQILELSNMKQCVNCKKKIEKSAKFCKECGTEQPEEVVHEVEVINNEEEEVNPQNSPEENERNEEQSNLENENTEIQFDTETPNNEAQNNQENVNTETQFNPEVPNNEEQNNTENTGSNE